MIFETIISSKNSFFASNASKIVSELIKNTSIQCSITLSKSFSQTFQSEHQKSSVQKFSEFCSFFSIDTIKSICEIDEKSTVIEIFILQISHISFTILVIILSICLNFSIVTFEIMLKSMKNASNQEITCVQMICKLCKQNFNFNKKLYEHIRNHEILKIVKNFSFSIVTVKSICKTQKNSTVIIFKKNCSICRINVLSIKKYYFEQVCP